MHHLQWDAQQQLNENVEEDMKEASMDEDVAEEAPNLMAFAWIVDPHALPWHRADGTYLVQLDAVVNEGSNL